MKRWIVGVDGVDIEVRADGVIIDQGGMSVFFVKDGDKNRNVAVFATGKWEYWMEELA